MTLGTIDCDIHPGVPDIKALLPYTNDFRQESFVARGIDGFDMMSYPLNAPITCRPDWRINGQRPAATLDIMRSQALDPFGIGTAICNPLTGGQVAVSESMGAAICSAVNDWIKQHWLDQEPRLRASIVVPAQAPLLAAEEIDRCAGDHRFVQVLLPVDCEMMLGRSYYWPIYEAAARHGLPIGIHAGSLYRYAPTSTGWPSHYLHDYVAQSQTFEDQVLSLISNGIFNKFPNLKFVLIESGVSWLPGFLWRAVKTWRGVRAEVPWVNRSPADIIRDNIRLTIQPFEAQGRDAVERIVEQIDADHMLLFASDYPYWQLEGDAIVPLGLGAELQRKGGNTSRNLDAAAALCSAMNDWQAHQFVDPEPRLRASILVPQDDPEAAVKEIEKRTPDWRFAQIQLGSKTSEPLGRRRYWPIFAAAQANNMSIGLHIGGTQNSAPSAGGWPQFYLEDHHVLVHSMQNQAASMILEGVFEAFPRLKVVLIEGGFAWVPQLAWRLDAHWAKMRDEVPHLNRKPSEYMKSNLWFATQPVEEPEHPDDLRQVFEWIGWDRMVYSSDYPHWDFDNPHLAFKFQMTEDERRLLFRDNALDVYTFR